LKPLADVHHAILDIINLHRYNATKLSGPSQTLSTFSISSSLAGERKPDLREEQGHVLACISWGTCCAKLNVTVVEIDSACPHVPRILHAITYQYVNNSRTLAQLEKLNQILPSWFKSQL
jgi:hypothetical protein